MVLSYIVGNVLKKEEYRLFKENKYIFFKYELELCLLCFYYMNLIKYGLTLQLLNANLVMTLLIALSFTDFKYQLLSVRLINVFTASIILLKIINDCNDMGYLIAGIILYSFLKTYNFIYKLKSNQDAFGQGDFDIFFIIGLELGLYSGLVCLLISCLLVLMHSVKNKQQKVAFVPYITLAFIICFYYIT